MHPNPNKYRICARWLAIILSALFFLPILYQAGKGEAGEGDFEFSGAIQALPVTSNFVGEWTVSGRTVRVSGSTEIVRENNAHIIVGASVKVEGSLQTNGSVIAKRIAVDSGGGGGSNVSFSGKVENAPNTPGRLGVWKVAGIIIHVNAATYIKQEGAPVTIGARVEVEGVRRPDGSVDAFKIDVKSDDDDDEDEDNDDGSFEFTGVIESLPSGPGRVGQWSVGGRKVNVTPTAQIKPNIASVAIGFSVNVKGALRQDSSIDATEIEVNSNGGAGGSFVEFHGSVETLPGTAGQIGAWTISGRRVNVAPTTKIELENAPIAVGSLAEVKGPLLTDGSVNVVKLVIRNGADPNRFFGKIEALPPAANLIGDWRVDGRTVRVTVSTRIEREYGLVAVGVFVEIRGAPQSDGSINAMEIEVRQGPGGGAYMNYNPVTTVSAASYQEDNAPESIVAAFGANMSPITATATTVPLPLSLGDVSVIVDGKLSRLFFVSRNQINYQVPSDTPSGSANVVVMNGAQPILQGAVQVSSVALSLFTADASGLGAPAGLLLRVRANGQQVFESLVRFDISQNRLVPAPIARQAGEQLFLILFGTGLKLAANTDGDSGNGVAENVQVSVGGVNAQVIFAGMAPGFVGLDQLNIRIPDNAPANPNTPVVVRARDLMNNLKQANILTISLQ